MWSIHSWRPRKRATRSRNRCRTSTPSDLIRRLPTLSTTTRDHTGDRRAAPGRFGHDRRHGVRGRGPTVSGPPLRPAARHRIAIPRLRSGHVSRRRLLDRLDRAGAGDVVVVSAPAGWGKTALLAEWLRTDPV